MKAAYLLLNALFHLGHVSIICFVLLGWLIPEARPAHLALSLLTLGSWFILGRWLGESYCPVSDWHWKLKASIGEGRPEGTYITFLLSKLTGKVLDSGQVDRIVVFVTFAVTAVSLILNLRRWIA